MRQIITYFDGTFNKAVPNGAKRTAQSNNHELRCPRDCFNRQGVRQGVPSMKRDKLEIIRSILLICKNGGAKKTEIVYEANLNFKNADVYLKLLIDQKMILKEDKSFKTTPKGDELLI
jgi:predicted transcriptional regulator